MAVLAHEVVEGHVAAHVHALELVAVPELLEEGLDVAAVHAQLVLVDDGAVGAEEYSERDGSAGAFIAVTVSTEFVVGVFHEERAEELSDLG